MFKTAIFKVLEVFNKKYNILMYCIIEIILIER